MANPRVHEIASELGIESKIVLEHLKTMGEFVKGPSSSVAPPVARRVKAALEAEGIAAQPKTKPAAKAAPPKPAPVKPAEPAEVTEPDADDQEPVEKPLTVAERQAQAEAERAAAHRRARRGGCRGRRRSAPASSIPRPGHPAAGQQPVREQPGHGSVPASRARATTRSRPPRACAPAATGGQRHPAPAHRARVLRAHGPATSSSARAARAADSVPAAPRCRPAPGAPVRARTPRRRRRLRPVASRVRGGRGRGPGGGTAGAFGRGGGKSKARKSKRTKRAEFEMRDAPTIGGVAVPRGDGSTIIRMRRGASIADFAEKIEVMTGFQVPPGNLVTVLFHLGEMATATESLDEATFEVLGAELGYKIADRLARGRGQGAPRGLRHRPRRRSSRTRTTRTSRSGRRSSPSWATSTTERPSCSTRSARPTSSPARPAASPSTSVPTRSGPSTRASSAPSPSSTPRATRRSPPCVPVVRR